MALGTRAQERASFIMPNTVGKTFTSQDRKQVIDNEVKASSSLYKTTAAPRWYSFIDYFDTSEIDGGTGAALTSSYLWKDTMAVMAYSGTSGTEWNHNRAVSLGLSIDPTFSGFNNNDYYNGEMKISSTDPYTVDSLRFFGIYGFRTANTWVDTLRITFVYGDGTRGNATSGPDVYMAKTGNPTVLSRYGMTDSMETYRMHFDSVTTHAKGTTSVVKDIIMDNTGTSPAWGDTLSNGWYYGRVALGDQNVPAGNLVGATITFISGAPGFTPHDTVFGSSIGYKYNMFRPLIMFRGSVSSSGAPAPIFAQYSASNKNSGMFKTLPDTTNGWGGQYIPLWFWSATGGTASTYQYPYIDFHVKCSPCATVGIEEVHTAMEASAYPNPATEELNVPFTLVATGTAEVTLSNALGQTVATKKFTGVSKGKAIFNTSSLAPGVYMYTVTADGKRASGRVAITK